MSDPNYVETITLLMPDEEGRMMTLAEAVRAVMHTENPVKKMAVTIIRDQGAPIGHAEIERIYWLPDFPCQISD